MTTGRNFTSAIYGTFPAASGSPPVGARQVSPLIPGAAALEEVATGTLEELTLSAPRHTLERRYTLALGLRALRPGAPFTVMAAKDQGGGRIGAELTAFGCTFIETSKHHHRICKGARPATLPDLDTALAAGALQFVPALGLWSQPGIFSWDRIDPGSALLIAHLPTLSGHGAEFGCGIGILGRAILASPAVQTLSLIDIDLRAVIATARNIDDARATVTWADVTAQDGPAAEANDGLDFVVSNPPFHAGGTQDHGLGQRFIAAAARRLRSGGVLFLVANRHLPYEAELTARFTRSVAVAADKAFKIIAAYK